MRNSIRLFINVIMLLLCLSACSHLNSPSASNLMTPDVENLQTGVYVNSICNPADTEVKFSYDLGTKKITILDVHSIGMPTPKGAYIKTYEKNYYRLNTNHETSVEDYIMITTKGRYELGFGNIPFQSGQVSLYTIIQPTPENIQKIGMAVDKLLTKRLNDMIAEGKNNPKIMLDFVQHYCGHPLQKKLWDQFLQECRAANTFERAKMAYDMTGSVEDAKLMDKLAQSADQKKDIDRVALRLTADKSRIFNIKLKMDNVQAKDNSNSGLFVVSANATSKVFSGTVSISPSRKSPITLSEPSYTVNIECRLNFKMHIVRKSSVLGDLDEIKTEVKRVPVTLKVTAPDYTASGSVNFGQWNLSYSDRGSMGGSTTGTLVEDPSVEYEIVSIQ